MALVTACLTLAGCDGDTSTPTSSTTTTTTTTIAEASIVEGFIGSVTPGGASFYSFSVAAAGTVNITYTAASGSGVPGTVWLGLGLGSPSGEDCTTTTTVNTPPGTAPQITGTYNPGVYCVRVTDIGNLFARANFAVTIAHP